MIWKIIFDAKDPVIRFAAEELGRYLREIDSSQEILFYRAGDLDRTLSDALYLSITEKLLPEGADPAFDDAIWIDIRDGRGFIRGSNSRSVLIGVYRFLRELGCAWIRPGRDGEIIPRKSLSGIAVSVRERPSYRHRGIAIEGAVSYAHVVDMIDEKPAEGIVADGMIPKLDQAFEAMAQGAASVRICHSSALLDGSGTLLE